MAKELNIQDILQGIDQLRQSQAESGRKFDIEMEQLRQSQAESGRKFDIEMDKFRQSQAESGRKFDIEMDKFRQSQAESGRKFDIEMDKLCKFQAETGKQISELRQSQAESGKKFDIEMEQLRQSQAESGRKFDIEMEQLRQSQAETGKQISELRQSQAESGKKFDIEMDKLRQFQDETSKQMEETFRKLDSVGTQLAAIGLNTGQSAEEFFFRSVKKTLKLAGIQFDHIERNVSLSEESPEFDMMLINGSHVMLLEVKYKAHPDQVEKLAKGKTKFFRKQYTDYQNHALHFGIASMIAPKDLIEASQKAGVYLITQEGDHVAIANGYLKSW